MFTAHGFGPPVGELAKGVFGAGSDLVSGGVKAVRAHAEIGDWHCPQCNDLQFARNYFCRRCKAGKPKDKKYFPRGGHDVATSGGHFAKSSGDWVCKACGNMVHAKRDKCHYCTAPKPKDMGGGEKSEAALLALAGAEAPKALGWIAPEAKLQTTCNAWSGQWGTGLTTSSIALKPVTQAPVAASAGSQKRDASSDSPATKKEKAEKKLKKTEKKEKEDTKKAEAAKKEEEKRLQMKERREKKAEAAKQEEEKRLQMKERRDKIKEANPVVPNAGPVALIDDDEVVLDD